MMRLFSAVLPLQPDIVVNVPNSCLLSWLKSKTRAMAAKVSDASENVLMQAFLFLKQ